MAHQREKVEESCEQFGIEYRPDHAVYRVGERIAGCRYGGLYSLRFEVGDSRSQTAIKNVGIIEYTHFCCEETTQARAAVKAAFEDLRS